MPKTMPRAIYLTYDDGPNPTTTPDLLDVLEREGVRAFDEGHTVALHSHTTAWIPAACRLAHMRLIPMFKTRGFVFGRVC